jgi:NRPS condensation-like uncharacterized protein
VGIDPRRIAGMAKVGSENFKALRDLAASIEATINDQVLTVISIGHL